MNPNGVSSLFGRNRSESDVRSAFFAMASLMMILLPTLLMVTNPQKIVTVPLSLSKATGTFTPTHTGPVEKIKLIATLEGFVVEMDVRKSDVLASTGNTETKSWNLTTWTEVQDRLQQIQSIDPQQQKIYLRPTPTHDAQTVIQWLDQLQLTLGFTDVVLEHPQ